MTDAYGRRLSARNTPTGPGSRGGQWHDPAFRAAYFARWRVDHPEYRERERRRRLLSHAVARLTKVLGTGAGTR